MKSGKQSRERLERKIRTDDIYSKNPNDSKLKKIINLKRNHTPGAGYSRRKIKYTNSAERM